MDPGVAGPNPALGLGQDSSDLSRRLDDQAIVILHQGFGHLSGDESVRTDLTHRGHLGRRSG